MTVASEISRNDYELNGATVFPYTFRVLSAEEIGVVRRSATTGVETTLTYPADFSVSGVGNTSGGAVTLASAGTAGDLLTIFRDGTFTQPIDLANQGRYSPADVERALDHGVMLLQQLHDETGRTVRLGPSFDPADFDLTLPGAAANEIIGWGPDGVSLASYPASSFGATAAAMLSGYLNVKEAPFNAVGSGSVNDRAAIAAADAAAGAIATVYFPAGTYRVDSNLTITAAVLRGAGAHLKPASGVTITFNGPVQGPLEDWIDTSLGGAVVFGAGSLLAVIPDWWTTSEDWEKISFAIESVKGAKIKVQLLPRTYSITNQIFKNGSAYNYTTIHGAGMGRTIVFEQAGATVPASSKATLCFSGATGVEFAYFTVKGQGSVTVFDSAHLHLGIAGTHCPEWYIHDVEATNTLAEALYVDGDSPRSRFIHNYSHNNGASGININASSTTAAECIISGNIVLDCHDSCILVACQSVIISGNNCRQATPTGGGVINMSAAARYFEITNNIIWGSNISLATVALICVGVANISVDQGIVSGNIMLGNTVASAWGCIEVTNTSGPVLITGNVAVGNGTTSGVSGNTAAVILQGANLGRVTISGNQFAELGGLQKRGILINAGTNAANTITIGPNDLNCTTPYEFNVAPTGGPCDLTGTGAPALNVPRGSIYRRTDGGAGTTLYIKETAGDAVWAAK